MERKILNGILESLEDAFMLIGKLQDRMTDLESKVNRRCEHVIACVTYDIGIGYNIIGIPENKNSKYPLSGICIKCGEKVNE